MRVGVIGAGAAGLATARALRDAGLDVTVFERRSTLGGVWAMAPPSETFAPPMYSGLRTNLPTEVMAFRDFPFRPHHVLGSPTSFVGHADVLRYLTDFAAHHELTSMVRLEHEVVALTKVVDGWSMTIRQGAQTWAEPVDAIAVCNGHYTTPHVPSLAGAATTRITTAHSLTYREPSPFVGQRVVLLGAKASGVDLALEIGEVAERTILSGRAFEHSLAPTAHWPIERRPAVVRFEGEHDLRLADDSVLHDIQHLVFCTGYRFRFEFLPPSIVDVEDDYVSPLHLDVLSVREPTLAFIGLPLQVVPFPLCAMQARWVAAMWSGRLPIPAQHPRLRARAAAADPPARHRLRYAERQFDVYAELARRCGAEPYPAELRRAYEATGAARRAHPKTYRDA